MTNESAVNFTIEDKIARLVIKREKSLNALNKQVLSELSAYCVEIQNAADRGQVRVLVVSGGGEKAFVAGADVSEMAQSSDLELKKFIELGQSVMSDISKLSIPSVAMVQGFALGGGFELALSCDVIVASEKASFGFPETKLGLIPGFGGTQRCRLRAGVGVAKRLIFSAEIISARTAYELGVCDVVVSEGDLVKTVESMCRDYKARGARALATAKSVIDEGCNLSLQKALENEKEAFIEVFKGSEAKEGMQAFLNKRTASF